MRAAPRRRARSRGAPLGAFALAVLAAACDTPSSGVDPADLRGAFDERPAGSASAQASASAAPPGPSASAAPSASIAAAPRPPGATGCVDTTETPLAVRRTAGRPACRGAEVLEWRDGTGAPRYGCVYGPRGLSDRQPLPLVTFFPGTGPALDDPSAAPKITALTAKQETFALDPDKPGYVVLAVQGRAFEGSPTLGFDVGHVSPDAPDVATADHFVDVLLERGAVDPRRVYAVGMGQGATMAVTWAMLRPDRVAASAVYAPLVPPATWRCPGPPPPLFALYRACDAVAPCEATEAWFAEREASRGPVTFLRLGDVIETEPSCRVKNQCTPKRAAAAHHRWPKGRENDLLRFLAGHALAR